MEIDWGSKLCEMIRVFGLYSDSARRAPNRKRLFFLGVGGRFTSCRPNFLAFCHGLPTPCLPTKSTNPLQSTANALFAHAPPPLRTPSHALPTPKSVRKDTPMGLEKGFYPPPLAYLTKYSPTMNQT